MEMRHMHRNTFCSCNEQNKLEAARKTQAVSKQLRVWPSQAFVTNCLCALVVPAAAETCESGQPPGGVQEEKTPPLGV